MKTKNCLKLFVNDYSDSDEEKIRSKYGDLFLRAILKICFLREHFEKAVLKI